MNTLVSCIKIFLIYEFITIVICSGESNLKLHRALESKNINDLDLEKWINISTNDELNFEDSKGQTPLFLSAVLGNTNAFERLQARGANSTTNKFGQTLLHAAVLGGNIYIINLILNDNEISLNAQDEDGNTVMHYVAQGRTSGNISEVCSLLLDEGALLTLKNNDNKTPYHLAVINKLINVLEVMITYDAFKNDAVRMQDENGHTPLQISLDKNFTEIFKLLINRSVNPFEQDLKGRTVIHNAVMLRNEYLLRIVLLSNKTFRGDRNRIISYKEGLDYRDILNYTALHWAVEIGFTQAVNLLLGFEFITLNSYNYYNNNLLHSAVRGGNREILDKILNRIGDKESYINGQNKDGQTALHLAIQEQRDVMIESLLGKRANGFIPDNNDQYPIGFVASFSKLSILKLFKKYNYTLDKHYNATELLAFAVASGNDHNVIEELLMDVKNRFQSTFLAPAVPINEDIPTICNSICTIKTDNCSINTKEQKNITGILRTITADHEKFITELAEEDEDESSELFVSKPTMLNYALFFNGNEMSVKNIIECSPETKCDICTINESWSPIDVAAFRGKLKIVEYLIKICNDCNKKLTAIKDLQGQTVMHKAAWGGHCEILEYLYLNESADINVKDKWGRTPLHVAALRGYKKAIDCILRLDKSSLNTKDKYEFTPLHLAEIYGHHKFFTVLQKTSITLDPVLRYQMKFPGTKNRLRNHTDVIQSLLDNGADPDAQDQTLGWTILHWAASNGDMDVVKMLLNDRVRARVNLPSQNDQTPMYLARFWGRSEVYNYLKLHDGVW